MKLLFAILNRDDANEVVRNLSSNGFYSTKLATTGGFLLANNITLMIGVADDRVDSVIDIIRTYSHSRKQIVPGSALTTAFGNAEPVEVSVGGATIFVVDVDRFEKV